MSNTNESLGWNKIQNVVSSINWNRIEANNRLYRICRLLINFGYTLFLLPLIYMSGLYLYEHPHTAWLLHPVIMGPCCICAGIFITWKLKLHPPIKLKDTLPKQRFYETLKK